MRLDEGLEDQKLSLDITPLIDIIFLLVLFFAVSTSFISGEDLRTLQRNVVDYDDERKVLAVTVEQQTEAISTLETDFTRMVEEKTRELQELAANLEEADGKAAKLEFMVGALENQKIDLETRLTNREEKNKSLETQLEDAFADLQGLNAELTAVRSDVERRAEEERLLRALLLERESEGAELRNQAESLQDDNSALAEQMRTLQVLLETREGEGAELKAELEASSQQAAADRQTLEAEMQDMAASLQDLTARMLAREQELQTATDEAAAAAQQEILLQKLLADKAAELDGMRVRLESADASAAAMRAELDDAKSGEADAATARAEARTLNTQVLRLQAELNKLRQVATLDREQIERILRAQEQLEQGLGEYLNAEQLGLKRDKQRLTLELSNRILFASGKATIKREGLEVLRNLGRILKERMNQLEIQIGGHTDNVPVRGRSGPLADNWGLSAARAVTVVRFFETEVGIDATRMSAVGYGEHRPVSGNETRDGRSQNRRIEIVLLPK